jgi:branched-subunit amino acid transport protein
MTDWEIWVVILVLGVATACTRSAFWLIGHRVTIPPRVQEMLRFAPACALAAIVFPGRRASWSWRSRIRS